MMFITITGNIKDGIRKSTPSIQNTKKNMGVMGNIKVQKEKERNNINNLLEIKILEFRYQIKKRGQSENTLSFGK
jgi:hypothetical protein